MKIDVGLWLSQVYHISSVIRWSFVPFKTIPNPQTLDPSYKMDLDLWGCFGGVNFLL